MAIVQNQLRLRKNSKMILEGFWYELYRLPRLSGTEKSNLVKSPVVLVSQVSGRRKRVRHNGSDGWRRESPVLRAGHSKNQGRHLSRLTEFSRCGESSVTH